MFNQTYTVAIPGISESRCGLVELKGVIATVKQEFRKKVVGMGYNKKR